MTQIPKFFLGSNSQDGFVSYFDQLQETPFPLQLIILKGGPGSGKSSLMKRVLNYALAHSDSATLIPCASDPGSLDAVIDHTAGLAIMDGTAPHTLDPKLPGARQHIMYTGDMWDCKKLSENAESIEKHTQLIGDCHKGACSYIKAASALLSQNSCVSVNCINEKSADKVVAKIVSAIKGGEKFREEKRLLSAVCPGQILFFDDTPALLADKIYVISDNYGGFADYVLKKIYAGAVLKNEEIILCPCSLNPKKVDHIIFPKSRIAVLKENEFLKASCGEKIDAKDFYSFIPMRDHIEKRQKISSQLLSAAGEIIGDAKRLHDELEVFYADAMDFSKADGFFAEIISRYFSI